MIQIKSLTLKSEQKIFSPDVMILGPIFKLPDSRIKLGVRLIQGITIIFGHLIDCCYGLYFL